MKRDPIERSKAMLEKAESDGADEDVALWEVAAMVYVGDIYALVALGSDEDDAAAPPRANADSVWPFIR